jgi:hypothetical protein
MDTSTHILVIALSILLGIFLILSVVIAVQIVRLLRAINRIVEKAGAIIDTAEHVGKIFGNVSGPLAVAKLVHNIVDAVVQHNKRSK